MGFKKTIEELILNKSNSYRFYKEFYEKNNNVDAGNLEQQVKSLQKDFNDYKRNTTEYIDSCNFLFNTLFLDYEVNNPVGLFKNIQDLCKELLHFINNVCVQNDIEWWIDGGNLLGAVRHGGFIPWDDDMDIAMLRKDYLRFNGLIGDEIQKYKLGDILKLQYRHKKIEGNTVNSFIQLFIRHPVSNSNQENPYLAGVDVFPFDFIKDYNPNTIVDDHYNAKINYYRNMNRGMDLKYCLDKLYEELNLSMDPTDKIIPSVEGSFGKSNQYKLIVMDADEMLPFKKIKFEDTEFPAPNNPDYYLKLVYGDYMNVPKSIRTHSRIEAFRYSDDAAEIFEDCHNRLKEVNDQF